MRRLLEGLSEGLPRGVLLLAGVANVRNEHHGRCLAHDSSLVPQPGGMVEDNGVARVQCGLRTGGEGPVGPAFPSRAARAICASPISKAQAISPD